ncbi:MAG: hypothetical protein H0W72_04565 [Planctomycetes bacterium]|nr:hypothetical protein [Planctomycetota bacterium]
MPRIACLLALLLVTVSGFALDANEAAETRRASQLELQDRRIAKNDAAIAELQAKRAELVTQRDQCQADLERLDKQLAEVGRLSDQARAEASKNQNERANADTLRALNEANLALTPLQKGKRPWTQSRAAAETGIVDIDRRLVGRERQAEDLVKERKKLAEAQ